MTPSRRALLGALPLLAMPGIARAEDFPGRTLRLLVPFPPGGGVDAFARPLAPALASVLRTNVVVENIGGASSRIGTNAAIRAPADGLTLLVTNDTLAAIEALPVAGSGGTLAGLTPVTLGVTAPQLIVTHPRSGIPDAAALAERLRSRTPPNLGIPGIGSSQHFASALLAHAAGGAAQHIPYRGGGPLIADLLAGVVDAAAVTLGVAVDHMREGRLRGLVVTSAGRHPAAPSVPSAAETIAPGFAVDTWIGLLAPAGLRPETVARLHDASVAALADPTVRARFAAVGYDTVAGDPARFGEVIRDTVTRFAAIAPVAGIRVDEA